MSRLSTCGDKPVNIPEQECESCSGLESRVSSLETCCDEAKESISTLDSDMDAAKQAIDALNSSADNLAQRMEDVERNKQNALIAGDNITIVDDIISASGGDKIRIAPVANRSIDFGAGQLSRHITIQLDAPIEDLLNGGTLIDIKTQYILAGGDTGYTWFGETFGVSDSNQALNPIVNQDVETVRNASTLETVIYRQISGNINYTNYPTQAGEMTVFFIIHD